MQENSVAHDADPEGLESQAEDRSALSSDTPTEVSGAPDHDAKVSVDQVSKSSGQAKMDPNAAQAMSLPIDSEAAQTPAPSETNHSGADAKTLGPKSEKSKKPQGKPRIKPRERPKRARTRVLREALSPQTKRKAYNPVFRGSFLQRSGNPRRRNQRAATTAGSKTSSAERGA
ncbi:hypothetical protein PYH37_006172 (plasmid) [Sinorhizobium numidicum]|uniref:Uncharacterized protein n=1 Tax=Sinorhizobium numidicum TaxID=680248 RepID=A0ABY8D354_9HYPH|nr:hypothetical protein [Sinorhizobium numidicum]WEX79309.1 hypothetical protein PYH37_006172 [Sinorhizobium numidicum]WEX85320.1 hypothetical protein PYH38_006213 [Sinorhizobium numidicum]